MVTSKAIPNDSFADVTKLPSLGMETDEKKRREYRRELLRELCDRFYKGNIAALARACDLNPTVARKLLYQETKKQWRGIGIETIEKVHEVHPGWFYRDVLNAGESALLTMIRAKNLTPERVMIVVEAISPTQKSDDKAEDPPDQSTRFSRRKPVDVSMPFDILNKNKGLSKKKPLG